MPIILDPVTAVVVLSIATGTVVAEEEKDPVMNKSKQTIDRLVERLEAVKPVVGEIARSLGSATIEKNGRATARMDAPPFEGADIEDFRGVIKINFRMAAGTWRFQDITDKAELWSIAPPLPDTGQIDAVRSWEWKHLRVRCVVGVAGSGSMESRLVRDIQCQVRSGKAQ
jgi:hypothetical protein